MKGVHLLLFALGAGVLCGGICIAEEPPPFVTTCFSPLFAGPGPYYERVTVLPAAFRIQVPQEAAKNAGWWLRVTGFPDHQAEFKKLMAARPSGPARTALCISVRNAKHESEMADALKEVTAQPLNLGELVVSCAIRGFTDWTATSPAGKAMSRTDLAFVLKLPFSLDHLKAFREARAASLPRSKADAPFEESNKFDFLSRLQMGLHAVNRLSKRLEGNISRQESLDRYLNLIAARMAENSVCYDRRFRMVLWDNHELRAAYSTPGGFIILTTGLLRECRNEAELAGLVAHEMAHVYLEHGLKVKGYAAKATRIKGMPDLEEELDKAVEVVFGLPPVWQLGSFAHLEDMAVDFLEKTLLKHYLTEDEKAADQFAVVLLHNSGYDAEALGCLLSRLDEGRQERTFLTNHGPVEERLHVLRLAIESLRLSNPAAQTFEEEFRAAAGALLGSADE